MKFEVIRSLIAQEFMEWPVTKDGVAYYGFREYIKGEFGIEYDRSCYHIIDEKKFMWFLLKSKHAITND
jgi:hypothetical protein